MRWTLSVKIALGIAAILIAVMSASVILNVIFVRNQLMADNRNYALHLSEVTEAGLENAMIIKDPEKIKSIMKSIGSRANIMGVAIFDKRGEIKYSINPGDVGRTFSKNDPMCIICHGGTLSDQTQTVILPSKQDARILKVVRPIMNQPNCQGCHRERVLGMLMVDLSLAEVEQRATAMLGQQMRQSLATVVIVIIALIGFMYLIVTRPLAHFVRITRAIDNGDLDKRVNPTHKDELGELGASFNRMVESMAARTQELERLNEIAATQITARRRAEEVMQESEERYRSLVELSPEAVVVHSEGKIIYINKSGEKIFGASDPGEMIGKPIKDLVHPDYWERVSERVKQVLEKKEPTPLQELIFNRLNGVSINVETAGVPITFSGKIASLTIVRDISERKRMEKALRDSEKRYRELSIVDGLTLLYNSRHFYFQLKIELDRSNRYGQPLTLLLLDLDNFKHFNDTYGHVEGDQVLRRLGQVVKRCLRETDFAYRYGGEEFTIVLPMTTSADGAITAERIRTEFKKETFSPAPGQDVHVTVSIGLAQYKPKEEMKVFVHRVDQLMYRGKKNGKDNVCCES